MSMNVPSITVAAHIHVSILMEVITALVILDFLLLPMGWTV